jgi:hypothetical protein
LHLNEFVGGRAIFESSVAAWRNFESKGGAQLRTRSDVDVQTGRVGKGLASAVTPNTKSIAAPEVQAKSSVGVDATLLPGF